MQASQDNIYVGCKVRDSSSEYTVVKINKSSMYITTMEYGEFREKYSKKCWGTWKEFCKANGIELVKYGKYFIDDSEVGRKAAVESNDKLEEEYCRVISSTSNVLDTYWLKNDYVRVLGKREDCYVLNISGEIMLYCSGNRERCNLGKIYEYNYSSIPWEKLSKYSSV
jgi:hypothetical protein